MAKSETTYTVEEIANMNGITLEKPLSVVNVQSGLLQKVARNGKEVSLIVTKHGTTEMLTIKANIRSIQYLNTKSVKRQKPFGESEFKTFMNAERGEIVPKYNFSVFALCEHSTKMAFGVTFKPLIPLNEKVFTAYMKGEKYTPIQNIPFELGNTELPTKNGIIRVNFGKYNGNSGISVTNAKNVKVMLNAKHLGNSINAMCKNLKSISESEAIQKAESEPQLKSILEGFKPSTM